MMRSCLVSLAVLAGGCGETRTIASDAFLLGLAVDKDHVFFWQDQGGGYALTRIDKDGAHGMALATTLPVNIVLDGENVYWTPRSGIGKMQIKTVAKNGGEERLLVLETSASNLVTDGRALYWLENQSGGQWGADMVRVMRLDKSGGEPQVLGTTSQVGNSIALDAENVYFSKYGNAPGTLSRVPKSGGDVVDLAVDKTGVGFPFSDLYVVGDRIYYFVATAIWEIQKDGGGRQQLVGDGAGNARFVANEKGLFWTMQICRKQAFGTCAFYETEVGTAALDGGGVRTLISGGVSKDALATDGDAVYWIDSASHVVRATR